MKRMQARQSNINHFQQISFIFLSNRSNVEPKAVQERKEKNQSQKRKKQQIFLLLMLFDVFVLLSCKLFFQMCLKCIFQVPQWKLVSQCMCCR